jgi:hypothetical protein
VNTRRVAVSSSDWLGLLVAMLPGKMNGTVRAEETAEDCTSWTRYENAEKRALW